MSHLAFVFMSYLAFVFISHLTFDVFVFACSCGRVLAIGIHSVPGGGARNRSPAESADRASGMPPVPTTCDCSGFARKKSPLQLWPAFDNVRHVGTEQYVRVTLSPRDFSQVFSWGVHGYSAMILAPDTVFFLISSLFRQFKIRHRRFWFGVCLIW